MDETKRPPLGTTDGGQLVDLSTGEMLKAPGPDPYTGTELVPIRQVPEVHIGPLPAHPPDLQLALERWKDDRAYVKRFLLDYLVECEYNEKGRPIAGRMHDYYKLPGKEEWRPTAVGAEKVALFFGLFKGPTETTVLSEQKDYVSIKARVLLVDASGRVRGAAEKVISSAEATFQEYDGSGLLKKYKGDARAALNDIASRAAKRAYVEAVCITCALGELFNDIAREKAKQPKAQVTAGAAPPPPAGPKRADPKPNARGLPTVMPIGTHAGEPLTSLKTEFLLKAREACRGRAEYDKLAEAIGEVLESRREAAEKE
jgi:hypothetical protein